MFRLALIATWLWGGVWAVPEPCNICGFNGIVGDLSLTYLGRSCQEWKDYGDGGLEPAECDDLQQSQIQAKCQCSIDDTIPTASPTRLTQVSGQLVIVLLNVTSAMSPSIRTHYEEDLQVFLATYFQQVTSWPGYVGDWKVRLDLQERLITSEGRRRRRLKGGERQLAAQLVPLETRLTVTALVSAVQGDTFEAQLKQTVDSRPNELLVLLGESESPVVAIHFSAVNQAVTFAPDEVVTTPRVQNIGNDGASLQTTAVVAADDDGLARGTIVGISIAAAIFVLLVIYICWTYWIKHHDERDADFEEEEDLVGGSSGNGNGSENSFRQSFANRGLMPSTRNGLGPPQKSMRASSNGRMGSGMSSADGSSRSSMSGRTRQLGRMRSASTRHVSSDGRTLSVTAGNSMSNINLSSGMGPGGMRSTELMQLKEHPNEHEHSDHAPPQRTEKSLLTDNDDEEVFSEAGSRFEDETDHPEESVQMGDAPTFTSHGHSSAHNDSSMGGGPAVDDPLSGMVTRQVVAPPGKLGIVVETRLKGPVVNKINDDSPLRGQVYEGDLITAIDEVDTRAMSASAITALMVHTSDKPRRMTIKSSH